MSHYHIRWSDENTLDWQPFNSKQEASARADELVRQNETYTIQEFDVDCPRCAQLASGRQISDN